MKMKVVDFLKKREQWIKEDSARSAKGRIVRVNSAAAVRFCLFGALDRCYPHCAECQVAINKVFAVLRKRGDRRGIVDFNDDPKTTFRDVRRVLEEADV